MFATSTIHINRKALESNLQIIKNYLGPNVTLSSVIKGNAYGHGIEVFVPLAEECGINHFSVFNADEAFRAHKASVQNSTIMIMGMIENQDLRWAIKNDIEFFVFEFDRLSAALEIAREVGKPAKIHLEVETGMNRTGFNNTQLTKAIEILKKHEELFSLEGLCTHYAGAESIANHARIKTQIRRYRSAYKKVVSHNLIPKKRHTACSAAALSYPETIMDMARIGIMQYGFWPSIETFINFIGKKENKQDPLERVISWKSKVMNTKNVKTGEFIGYGTSYIARSNMKIATVPVGYAHGYSRSLSFQGRVLIHGQRVDVIGIVNMNLLIARISDVPQTEKGDEVVMIGKQGDSEITVASFGDFSNQLNYELLTRLPMDIPRVVKLNREDLDIYDK
ncbi:MAG: alanine racemase [Bacteroidales bacterium]|nr:alanine racemase [Bacteroidales bacterium]